MKALNKLTSLLLVAAMAVSLLTGCTKGKSSEGSASTTASATGTTTSASQAGGAEAQNFSMFAVIAGAEYSYEDNISFQKLCKDANISFDIQSVLPADLAEKKGLVLNSGEYPDVFFKAAFGGSELSKYGSQGVLIPLQDLIREHAPNLTKLLDERNAWQYLEDANGNIWSLPEVDRQDPGITVYWINKKWMDNLNLTVPTNLDELYTVLKAFKDGDPNGNADTTDEIPFTANTGVTTEFLLPYFDLEAYDTGTKTAIADGSLFYVPTSDKYKEYLAYLTKLYSEGILDKNCFTQAHEQQGAIGQSADVLGSFFDAGAFLTVGRDNDDDYIALDPFTKGTYPVNSGITAGTLCITDACEHPERVIAWADQLYSQEGGALAWLGIEGETYTLNDDNTWDWIIGGKYGSTVSEVRAKTTIQGTANHPSVQPDLWYTGMTEATDPDEVYLNEQRAKLVAAGANPRPAMFYSEADSQTLSTMVTELNNYVTQYTALVVTGEQDLESSWDSYVSTMEQMGAKQVEEIYQNTYSKSVQ